MADALLATYPGEERSRQVWIREEGDSLRQMTGEDDPALIDRAEIRASIEAATLLAVSLGELSERLVAMLDAIDGDPDREDGHDMMEEPDREPSPDTFSAEPTYGLDQRVPLDYEKIGGGDYT